MTPQDGHAAPALHAFEPLTPDVVLDALASVGLLGDGRLMALSSYENRVYQVHLEAPLDAGSSAASSIASSALPSAPSVVVAKFYRPGRWSDAQILEEHAFSAELMAAEIPVIGPLVVEGATLHHFKGFAFSVSPRRGGRAPELDNPEVLEWIGRFLARIHGVGAQQAFEHRPALDLASFGIASRDWLLQQEVIPLDVLSAWAKRSQDALDMIAENPFIVRAKPIRLHGDCHPGNILWTPLEAAATLGPGPHFVDLDDARTGPAVQDLWMLLSGDRSQRTRQLGSLIDGYEQFREFDRDELALIEPLRTLRLIHYSAWLARRWADPTFPINFPWFGSSDYWQGQVQMLEEQMEAMQEEPLVV